MTHKRKIAVVLLQAALLFGILNLVFPMGSLALGVVPITRYAGVPMRVPVRHGAKRNKHHRGSYRKLRAHGGKRSRHVRKIARPVAPPQNMISNLSSRKLAPGVVYKSYRGAISINIIDVDLLNKSLKVKPVLAGSSFNLADVKNYAKQTNAIAAVNANYFKKDGTPLGTLIVDKEWIAGPLYERVSMGITSSGHVRIERVGLHGVLHSDNSEVNSAWVNNINQPRHKGSLMVYTRRWGSSIRMTYPGTLVAVDNQDSVIDKGTISMGIPYGGYVLCDSKVSPIANLKLGDKVSIDWHINPNNWSDVVQAISGGPMLVRNNKLYLDLQDEQFRKSWTSRKIVARTAAGVTSKNHLLLVTVEGPHTLWDMAKLLHKLGAVEAMNLDGGGSTTMVIDGNTVTRNAHSSQRRVANALAIIEVNEPVVSGVVLPSAVAIESKLEENKTKIKAELQSQPASVWADRARESFKIMTPAPASAVTLPVLK